MIDDLKKQIGYDEISINKFLGKGVVFDWEDFPYKLKEFKELKNKSLKEIRIFEDLRCDTGTALREWSFVGVNKFFKVQVYVSNDILPAKNRLLIYALSNTMTKTTTAVLKRMVMQKRPCKDNGKNKKAAQDKGTEKEIEKTGFYLYSPYYKMAQWWFYNVYFSLEAYNFSIDMDYLTSEIEDVVEKKEYVKNSLWKHLPFIKDIEIRISNPDVKCVKNEIRLGGVVEIHVEPEKEKGQLMVEFFFSKGNSLCFLGETEPQEGEKYVLKFKGRVPGVTEIQLVLVNTSTLLCSPLKLVTINVT
jgi:hypothetical protein